MEINAALNIGKVIEALKSFYNSKENYKQINDNLYITRSWYGSQRIEELCIVLNDKVSIYVDSNISATHGDIITGSWDDLTLEECNNYLNYILPMFASSSEGI